MSQDPGDIEADFDDIEDIPFALDQFLTEEGRVEVDHGGKQRTVEPREIFEFEYELVDELTEIKTNKDRKGANIPIKGPWIHDWLEEKGSDYPANIFRNYQLFLKFVQGETDRRQTASTVNRKPGTYDSMYTYLLVLEKLDLVERFANEEIPRDDFEHNIPEDFQDRTLIRVTTPLSEAPEEWTNPFKAQYPDNFSEEDGEVNKEEAQASGNEESDEEKQEQSEDIDELSFDPDQIDTIDDFDNPSKFLSLFTQTFDQALTDTIDDPPVAGLSDNFDEDDYELGKVSTYGVWATGNAIPSESGVNFLIEIESTERTGTPGFITEGVANRIERQLNTQNPVPEIFSAYNIEAGFASDYDVRIGSLVDQTEGSQYYELREEEFITP